MSREIARGLLSKFTPDVGLFAGASDRPVTAAELPRFADPGCRQLASGTWVHVKPSCRCGEQPPAVHDVQCDLGDDCSCGGAGGDA